MSLERPTQVTQISLQVQKYSGERPSENFLQHFDTFPVVIGRAESCDFVLTDVSKYISSKHARIFVEGCVFYIEDTSANGVYLNGSIYPLGRGNSAALNSGDTLSIGDFRLLFEIENDLNQLTTFKDFNGFGEIETTEIISAQTYANTECTSGESTRSVNAIDEQLKLLESKVIQNVEDKHATLHDQEPMSLDSPLELHNTASAGAIQESDAIFALLQELKIAPELVENMDSVTLLKGIGQLLDQSMQALILLLNVTDELSFETDHTTDKPHEAAPIAIDSTTKSQDAILLLLREQCLSQNKINTNQYLNNQLINSNVKKAITIMRLRRGVALDKIENAIESSLKIFQPQQLEKILTSSNKDFADPQQSRNSKLWQTFDQRYSEFVGLARASFYEKIDHKLIEINADTNNTSSRETQDNGDQ